VLRPVAVDVAAETLSRFHVKQSTAANPGEASTLWRIQVKHQRCGEVVYSLCAAITYTPIFHGEISRFQLDDHRE
jgi:hypothetical protein